MKKQKHNRIGILVSSIILVMTIFSIGLIVEAMGENIGPFMTSIIFVIGLIGFAAFISILVFIVWLVEF